MDASSSYKSMSAAASTDEQAQSILQAREAMEVLYEMATLLNTGLDREALSICVSLCEDGVNPEALAAVIKELRREAENLKAEDQTASSMSASYAPSAGN